MKIDWKVITEIFSPFWSLKKKKKKEEGEKEGREERRKEKCPLELLGLFWSSIER